MRLRNEKKVTSSLSRVPMHLPISRYLLIRPTGPKSMNRNLVSRGTSVKFSSFNGDVKRINATISFSKKSTSPMSTLAALASLGIFLFRSLLT